MAGGVLVQILRRNCQLISTVRKSVELLFIERPEEKPLSSANEYKTNKCQTRYWGGGRGRGTAPGGSGCWPVLRFL